MKARKRGQYWTCWRFASAQVDWLASMLWGRSRTWADLDKKLTTWEHVELDTAMRDDRARIPLSAWDFSTPDAMDDGFCELLERTIALAREKAEHLGANIPFDLAEGLMRFIRVELGKAQPNCRHSVPECDFAGVRKSFTFPSSAATQACDWPT